MKVLCFSKLNRNLLFPNLFKFKLVDANGWMAYDDEVQTLELDNQSLIHYFLLNFCPVNEISYEPINQ
ncbi:hypothetical protein ASE74_14020 [Pedobacter sp. Leaf216]|nr:hypothetical protein ASE74_14020 [Pedobacter sp. Leaf216]